MLLLLFLDDELGRQYTPALYYELRNFQEPLDHIHCLKGNLCLISSFLVKVGAAVGLSCWTSFRSCFMCYDLTVLKTTLYAPGALAWVSI